MRGSEIRPAALELRQRIIDGLLYTHARLNSNQRKTLEAASFLYALVEQGLITSEEMGAVADRT